MKKILIILSLSILGIFSYFSLTSAATPDCSSIKPDLSKGAGKECGSDCRYQVVYDEWKCGAITNEYCLNIKPDLSKGAGKECGSDCEYQVVYDEWKCGAITTALKKIDLSTLGKANTGYKAKIIIPCTPNILGAGGKCPDQNTPTGYISRLYQFGLMIVGLVAFGAIIYGAVLYTLSAGNIGSKEDAKDQMLQAIYGLLLLMGAYVILYTINPNLVNLSNPPLETPKSSTERYRDYDIPTNTPTDSSGTTQVDGCEISSSGAFDDFGSIEGRVGTTTFNTATVELKCTKCMEGSGDPIASALGATTPIIGSELSYGKPIDGKCPCQSGLVRQPTGPCCPSGRKIENGQCCPPNQEIKNGKCVPKS